MPRSKPPRTGHLDPSPDPSAGRRPLALAGEASLRRRLVSLDRAERPTVVTSVRKARPKCVSMQGFDGQILLARVLNLPTWFDS